MKLTEIVKNDFFYLVSKSPRRKWLLSYLPLKFEIITPHDDIEISHSFTDDPHRYAKENSFLKAQSAARDASAGYIIACDTIVCADGSIYHKPKDYKEAYNSLKNLSGRAHIVVSGIVLYHTLKKVYLCESEETRIVFKKLSDHEIMDYINTGEPFGKAGSYGLQGHARNFLKEIKGTKSNVYGLPLKTMVRLILKMKGIAC